MAVLSAPPPMPVARVGMIARWKPVHLGHAAVLRGLCRAGREVWIGVGSSNKYDLDNPFTLDETVAMIRAVIGPVPHVRLLAVPDLGDGPRWAAMVIEAFGDLDLYCTANAWVRDLLAPTWDVLHPVHLVPPAERVPVEGRMVRDAMARGADWRALVPPEVAALLDGEGWAARFRREFGLATLARAAPPAREP